MTKSPRINLWFAATAVIFFTRATLFSTWLSRGPEVKDALHLDKAGMGWLVMLYPAGGLLGIAFAAALTRRYGSKLLTIVGFGISCTTLVALGFSVSSGNVVASGALLVVMGLPMAISDFVGNYEGAGVNSASKHSLMPAIHSSFGVGMVLASWVSSAFITAHVGLITNYFVIALVVLLPSIWAAMNFPPRSKVAETVEEKKVHAVKSRAVWSEPRTLALALIGFTFIMAEISAGTWGPLALTTSGFDASVAAAALGGFWIIITVIRAVGGFIVDRIGRARTVLLSSIINSVGVVVFMLDPVLHMPFIGLGLWAVGLSLGVPMVVTALSDDPAMSAARVNMFITVVYISSISVGPALGAVGQALGIYLAFGIPLALLIVSAFLSRVAKPQTN